MKSGVVIIAVSARLKEAKGNGFSFSRDFFLTGVISDGSDNVKVCRI